MLHVSILHNIPTISICNVPILSHVYIQAYHVHINQVNKDEYFCIILVQVCIHVQIYAHFVCLINELFCNGCLNGKKYLNMWDLNQ